MADLGRSWYQFAGVESPLQYRFSSIISTRGRSCHWTFRVAKVVQDNRGNNLSQNSSLHVELKPQKLVCFFEPNSFQGKQSNSYHCSIVSGWNLNGSEQEVEVKLPFWLTLWLLEIWSLALSQKDLIRQRMHQGAAELAGNRHFLHRFPFIFRHISWNVTLRTRHRSLGSPVSTETVNWVRFFFFFFLLALK